MMKVQAKQIEWTLTADGRQWDESRYGFSITYDPLEDAGYQYHAAWGEGEEDDFSTLE
jgi:hypothetical protein